MAYSIAVSLLNAVHKLQLFSDQTSVPYPKPLVESLRAEVVSIMSFLEKDILEPINDHLEKQIIDVLYEAQDIVESHVNIMSSDPLFREGEAVVSEKLLNALRIFDSIKEASAAYIAGHKDIGRGREEPSEPFVLSRFLKANRKFVGREDELMKLKDRLFDSSSELVAVAVLGMIGIGKTALVNEVYNSPLVGNTFDYQAWVTVGRRNGMREILLSLVKLEHDQDLSTEELVIRLGKMLSGRRFLIVLDDVHEIDLPKDLGDFFPDENNQSRIIITTRLLKSASRAGYIQEMSLLNEDESWDLLRYAAIGEEESCPPPLMKRGKAISKDCQGLPLKIITLGSLLSRMPRDSEEWSTLADDREMQNCEMLKVTQDLYYEKLPPLVKACFLYMVAFPQFHEVSTSKIVKLWIAENFLEPKSWTLEDVADDCLQALVNRSLVFVHGRGSRHRTKTWSIHSAIWPFYERAAAEYKIFQSIKSCKDKADPSHRRFSIHKNVLFAIRDVSNSISSVSNTRSLLCTGPYHPYPLTRLSFMSFRLLKVLDALSIRFYVFPVDIVELVLLRFVALMLCRGELPSSVSNLTQLEFLTVQLHSSIKSSKAPCLLPMEIWKMKELRHLQVMGSDLPDPPPLDVDALLPNLVTLSDVSILSCTEEILTRIPNLKNLRTRVELTWDAAAAPAPLHNFDHLANLYNLNTFKYTVMNPALAPIMPDQSRSIFPFVYYLAKLTLSGCGFSWESMKDIARLPNLQVLKLRCNAFRGPTWEATNEGPKFENLTYLMLEDLDLEHWRADSLYFPSLEQLTIQHCYKLHDIPSGVVGKWYGLYKIELIDCKPSLVDSAMRIKDMQDACGMTYAAVLRVYIHSSWA